MTFVIAERAMVKTNNETNDNNINITDRLTHLQRMPSHHTIVNVYFILLVFFFITLKHRYGEHCWGDKTNTLF